MDRSSRVFSGTREATSSLPPRCSRKVRSLTLRTLTPGTVPSAVTISSECAASAAEQVTSTVRPSDRESTTSIAVTAPPAEPTAVAMRPMDAGSPSAVSRTVIEYDADVTGPRGGVAGSPRAVSSVLDVAAVSVLMASPIVAPGVPGRVVAVTVVAHGRPLGRAGRRADPGRGQRG